MPPETTKSDNVKTLLVTHCRLGYTQLLLAIDVLFLTVILLDFARYLYLHLSLSSAFKLSTSLPFSLIYPVLMFMLFLLFVLPLLLALLKVVGAPVFVEFNPSPHPHRIVLAHVLFCTVFAGASLITERMEILSGWSQLPLANASNAFLGTAFQSAFGTIVRSSLFTRAITAIGSFGGVLLSAVIGYILIGKETSKPAKQYMVRASLADLPTELRPMSNRSSYPERSSAAPRIPATDIVRGRLLRGYYSKASSSSEQLAQIDETLGDCRSMIREFLYEKGSAAKEALVDFYTGPGRAFESALRMLGDVKTCVLLPYASSSLTNLLQAYCSTAGSRLFGLTLGSSDYYRSWDVQEDLILHQLRAEVGASGPIVIILNEVCYATGLRLPLEHLVRRIKSEVNQVEIRIIVDGTNAVGNRRRIPTEVEWDAYVFVPYRWLMATERCAVLIMKHKAATTDAYGLLRERIRKRDEEVKAIAALRGALEVLKTRNFEYFWDRCDRLRKAFTLGLPKAFQVVGAESGLETTYILCCYPTEPSVWRLAAKELDDAFSSICAYSSVVRVDPNRHWMRLAIPYHLDPRLLNRLNNALYDFTT